MEMKEEMGENGWGSRVLRTTLIHGLHERVGVRVKLATFYDY
jgi:hypothetical protein